ncbi:carboxypeptidase-like regulatory domain-containing protein [Flavobacterium sp. MAH-1]|uniref:Carboxypeptidase-like regulatory domain-containing protein n=1 Tax=Flavobacterium agri TaxID=2743471 RepID=A0A7Y8Y2P5_9FLAO|nr:alpha-2-macroglobulin family protein [Flavobacterium agri]NUY80789.1 carboxypeptidase-like regulatory domain-containing protein [Flavobacterium agri]NYA70813.1 carboxypeptidase-like regulatory domain-containing protein [Flavobacterium agri]
MKSFYLILLLLCGTAFAQNYQKKWDKVSRLETQGKVKSANRVASKIYRKAKRRENDEQILKSFFFRSKYLFTLDADAQNIVLENIRHEIEESSDSNKAIFLWIYARSLERFSNKFQYEIGRNKPLDDYRNQNIKQWTSAQLEREIEDTYALLFSDPEALRKISLKPYKDIFVYFDEKRFAEENLLEYLALEFIGSRVAFQNFYIEDDNVKALLDNISASSKEFAKYDLSSLEYPQFQKALHLFQLLEKDNENLKYRFLRLQYVYSSIRNSDEIYFRKLSEIEKEATDSLLITNILLQKAKIHLRKADKITAANERKTAMALLDSILAFKITSDTKQEAQKMKNDLLLPALRASVPQMLYYGENSRISVLYKNTDSISVSFHRIPVSIYMRDSVPKFLSGHYKTVRTKKPDLKVSYALPKSDDYFEYRTEFLLPKLDLGTYFVSIESPGGVIDENSYEILTVTDLQLIGTSQATEKVMTVVDRKSGKPVKDAVIHMHKTELQTNADGFARCEERLTTYDNHILITKGVDSLYVKDMQFGGWRQYQGDERRAIANIYMDRNIYRPGQKAFYKIILTESLEKGNKILDGIKVNVVVNDPKWKTIFSTTATTNEFGSVFGEFTIPEGGLTGEFTISIDEPDDLEEEDDYDEEADEHPFWDHVRFYEDEKRFLVEEYKRPKFEVAFNPITEPYKLGQTIVVKGKVKSYSGSLGNTKAAISIHKRLYGYYRNHRSEPDPVIRDTVEVSASGDFEVSLITEKDDSDDDTDQSETYTIEAEVTDLSGETRTATKEIQVYESALELNLSPKNRMSGIQESALFFVNSRNLDDQFLPTSGTLEFRLKSKERHNLKPREFPKPDIASIPDSVMKRLFPYEDLEGEQIVTDTSALKIIKVDTGKQRQIEVDFTGMPEGDYEITFKARDPFGKETRVRCDFKFSDYTLEKSPSKLFTAKILNKNVIKDRFALLQLSSVIPDLHVRLIAVSESKVYFEKSMTLIGGKNLVRIDLPENYRKGISFYIDSFFENYHFDVEIPVLPYTFSPSLEFETLHMRDRLQPSEKEKWSFKLSATDTDLQAEILASMYDTALDQLTQDDNRDDFKWMFVGNYQKSRVDVPKRKAYDLWSSEKPLTFKKTLLSVPGKTEMTQLNWFDFSFIDVPTVSQKLVKKRALPKKNTDGTITITGIVSDDSGPLPGANVVVLRTKQGVQTDVDGIYSISISPGDELVFSFVGMADQNHYVDEGQILNVRLKEGGISLGEVVVTGALGIQKKVRTEFNKISESEAALSLIKLIRGLKIEESYLDETVIRRFALESESAIDTKQIIVMDGKIISPKELSGMLTQDIVSVSVFSAKEAQSLFGNIGSNGAISIITQKAMNGLSEVKARGNFSETAFFYPDIKVDDKGRFDFEFTGPEALTSWKMRLLAHNKSGISGMVTKIIKTQKNLMVMPNFPRFLIENDSIDIAVKISNLLPETQSGTVVLEISDAGTMQPIANFDRSVKNFSVAALNSIVAHWKIHVPQGVAGLHYRVVATTGNHSDGEESNIPVLSSDMLILESVPIWVRENTRKEFVLENLVNAKSESLRHKQLSLEYISNPVWAALQSLPYLIEFEHECAEQTFARYYANTLAANLISSNPKIASVLEAWRSHPTNPENEKKIVLALGETPWFSELATEDEKKKRFALLLDLDRMAVAEENNYEKLKSKQHANGAFGWFDDSPDNLFITCHVLAGLGHLKKLVPQVHANTNRLAVARNATNYLDWNFTDKKSAKIQVDRRLERQYLYARSFFLKEFPITAQRRKSIDSTVLIVASQWKNFDLYEKAKAALILHRFGQIETSKKILESLKETSASDETKGMFWIQNQGGWYWYQAPIETQAMIIEAFAEINQDEEAINAMKVWLLSKKQLQNWESTKATTEAIYALLLGKNNWLEAKDQSVIRIGNHKIDSEKLAENEKEAVTGYVKINWKPQDISNEMGKIAIENKSEVPAYGGLYWQYLENPDKITATKGPSTIDQQLFVKTGDGVKPLSATDRLKVGDLVRVRLVITAKDELEYVHLKSMRASCFEPVDVLSGYESEGNLWFYKSTKDVATHFFFDRLKAGSYILEYDVRVNNAGDFSNGISTIQSMYAPEFAAHSKGIRVNVK